MFNAEISTPTNTSDMRTTEKLINAFHEELGRYSEYTSNLEGFVVRLAGPEDSEEDLKNMTMKEPLGFIEKLENSLTTLQRINDRFELLRNKLNHLV